MYVQFSILFLYSWLIILILWPEKLSLLCLRTNSRKTLLNVVFSWTLFLSVSPSLTSHTKRIINQYLRTNTFPISKMKWSEFFFFLFLIRTFFYSSIIWLSEKKWEKWRRLKYFYIYHICSVLNMQRPIFFYDIWTFDQIYFYS